MNGACSVSPPSAGADPFGDAAAPGHAGVAAAAKAAKTGRKTGSPK
jgi:hypothetical protein